MNFDMIFGFLMGWLAAGMLAWLVLVPNRRRR